MLIGAIIWGVYAVLQLTLPGHTFDPVWFALDCALCIAFAVMAWRAEA